MKYAMIFALALAGCFDSIVSDHCATGFTFSGGHCVAAGEDPDGGVGPGGDAGPGHDSGPGSDGSGPVCSADLQTDPDNCGACGVVCASGICIDGACQTGVFGQVIALGHDFQHYHATMARLLANSVALGLHRNVRVARWNGTSAEDAVSGTTAALTSGMHDIGRQWHSVAMPTNPTANALSPVDVLLVDAQDGNGDATEAAAQPWVDTFNTFLAGGGVIVVLEGTSGVSYRFAAGGGLYSVGAPVDATGSYAYIVDGSDAIAQQVISPYAAETTSVTFSGAPPATVATSSGDTVAFHIIRPH